MSSSAPQIAGEPVKYEDLPPEHKKKYDDLKAILEAELIGAFEKTRSHGIKFKGFQPEGALDGLDLSLPSDERTRALRQEVNYAVAHSLHRHSESLVNTLERVALNVVQEVTKHKYSPSGPALGTHQGEVPLYTRPPLQHTFAAPQQQGSPAYVVYKEGGDPGDYQFLYEPPKEVPHGYVCTYVPDCNNWMTQVTAGRTVTAGGVAGAGSSSGADAEKQAWLTKYATSTSYERSASAAPTVDEITAIMRDKFGILPKKRMIGYSKPYPNDYDLIPLPPKYRLPDFTKFSGSEGTSSIEHVSRYLAQLGMVSASDELRVRFFSQSLTGPAFGWYTSLLPDSVRTWKQLEEQFHEQYHSETTEASLADLTQVRQRRGETVSEYIQRFRTVRNRCYSVRLSEKEAVELAVAGLSAPLKDLTFQAEYSSLAHMVQKLTAYEQRHPELYQDKYKRVALIETDEDEDSAGDQEVAVAEWTRGAKPVSCKWVKQPGPAKGFDFDLSKTEQIFDLLLKEKQLKLPEGHKIPTPQEMNGKPYCKWHHTFTHATNDCKVLRGQIQMAIEQGRLLFGQFAMRVDTQPFPEVNMVDLSQCIGREPGFSFDINMAGLADRHDEDKPESSRSRGKDKKEADPRDRPQHDDRRIDLEGDGKLGYGFTSADELEEIEEVKKEIKKLLDAGFIRPCRGSPERGRQGMKGVNTDPDHLGDLSLVVLVFARHQLTAQGTNFSQIGLQIGCEALCFLSRAGNEGFLVLDKSLGHPNSFFRFSEFLSRDLEFGAIGEVSVLASRKQPFLDAPSTLLQCRLWWGAGQWNVIFGIKLLQRRSESSSEGMGLPHGPPSLETIGSGGEAEVVGDWDCQSVKEGVAPLASKDVRQFSSACCQVMKKEVWGHLPETKLPGYYHRLVRLVAGLDDPVRGAHADGEKQGRIMMENKCRVLASSAKLSNRKETGFSKFSDSV
ncbi:hypothetical protein QYE76_018105 [Lolium multiflorum]|uniref:Retrotransposon gag domain-containing protein n=1 Tax=Lolium multiflorum TaxID=4521 RepID=A0AAD8QJG0_LOLMU|nr:hypothetical protein QYE76_018105 [Lolium multiflorum]